MDNQSKKEKFLQKMLQKHAVLQSAEDASKNLKDLNDLLEDLINVLPAGCFCQPSQATINNLSLALLALSGWANSAPIPVALRLKLKAAILKVLDEIHSSPFSCCESIQALQELELVLLEAIDQPFVRILIKDHLQNLVQQFQGIIARYVICLACEPGPTCLVQN
ncbi:hypothetical protein [Bacillus mycoides]|uniref:hypothetical protein n=1 Tax=Bacillus mycoides TaxID=1405 RepID=UPI00273AF104|nr:hypothetical protein [Bacillus mycoides]